MLLPTFLAKMIDGGLGADSRGTIVKLAVVMAFTAVIACAASVLATSISAIITTKFSKDLRGKVSSVLNTAIPLLLIRDADMILYMENGDIKEAGDHDELMKQNGKYAVLYNSQFA